MQDKARTANVPPGARSVDEVDPLVPSFDFARITTMPVAFVGSPVQAEHRDAIWQTEWNSICCSADPAQAFIEHNARIASVYHQLPTTMPSSGGALEITDDEMARRQRRRVEPRAGPSRLAPRVKRKAEQMEELHLRDEYHARRREKLTRKLAKADPQTFADQHKLTTLQAIRVFSKWINQKREEKRAERHAIDELHFRLR